MASQIDVTKPIFGHPLTESVRENFEITVAEISDLQDVRTKDWPYLSLSGGVMTGVLELDADPQHNMEAATKQYVDNLAFAATGGVPEAPVDGMFYARGGSTGVSDPNDWSDSPLFRTLTIGNDTTDKLFSIGSYSVYNSYGLNFLNSDSIRYDRTNRELFFFLNDAEVIRFLPTGFGIVVNDPIDPLGIATKQYVDAQGSWVTNNYLPLVGGTLTGPLTIDGTNALNLGIQSVNQSLRISAGATPSDHATIQLGSQTSSLWLIGKLQLAGVTDAIGANPYRLLPAVVRRGTVLADNFALENISGIQWNAYYPGTNSVANYLANGSAWQISSTNNASPRVNFFYATTGTAGAPITWKQSLQLAGFGTYSQLVLGVSPENRLTMTSGASSTDRATVQANGPLMFYGAPITFQGTEILLSTDPISNLGVASKQYVDAFGNQLANYLPLTGGTLTGSLTIASPSDCTLYLRNLTGPDWPAVVWDCGPGMANFFQSMKNGLVRWSVEFGGTDQETGNNAGTNFAINRFADDGSFIDQAIHIDRHDGLMRLRGDPTAPLHAVTKQYVDTLYLPLAGGTLTGQLIANAGVDISTLASSNTSLVNQLTFAGGAAGINYANGNYFNFIGFSNGIINFIAGTDVKFSIWPTDIRASVPIVLPSDPTSAMQAVTKQYADAIDAKFINYLLLSGGVMTGSIGFRTAMPDVANTYAPGVRGGQFVTELPGALTINVLKIDATDTFQHLTDGPGASIYYDSTGILRFSSFRSGVAGTLANASALVIIDPVGLTFDTHATLRSNTGRIMSIGTAAGSYEYIGLYNLAANIGVGMWFQNTNHIFVLGSMTNSIGSTGVPWLKFDTLTGDATFAAKIFVPNNPVAHNEVSNKQYVDNQIDLVASITNLVGVYNPVTDMMNAVAGSDAVDGIFPPATPETHGWYVIVQENGTPPAGSNAPQVLMLLGDWIVSNGVAWTHLSMQFREIIAPMIDVLPIAGMVALNVQEGLEELQTNKMDKTAIGDYLPLTGGEMTGPLILWDDPVQPYEASTKQYVDLAPFLKLAGGTMLGTLTLHADPVQALEAATKQYADGKLTYRRIADAGEAGYSLDDYLLGAINTFDSIGNQANPIGFPGGANTGVLIHGYNANGSWVNQLFMGPGYTPDTLWYRASNGSTWNRWVKVITDAGGILQGPLHLAADPVAGLEATTKQYTDARDALYLPLTGGSVTGNVLFSGDPIAIQITNNPTIIPVFQWGGGLSFNYSAGGCDLGFWNLYDGVLGFAWYQVDTNNPTVPIRLGYWARTGLYIESGPVTLRADPINPLEATTKQYVDLLNQQQGDWVNNTFLKLAGGVLTGPLTLVGNPIAALEAAPKQYVDAGIANIPLANYLPLVGGTLTGPLMLAADPVQALEASTKNYVDALGAWVNTYFLSLAGGTLTGVLNLVADPIQPLEAATKQYVDFKFGSVPIGNYLPLTGGTITGNLTVNGGVSINGAGIVYNASNAVSFLWTGSQLQAWIDGGFNYGELATVGNLAGYLPLAGGTITGNFIVDGYSTLNGGVTIRGVPTDTEAQLFIRPTDGANSRESKIRFGGTFGGAITDLNARFVASIRSGMLDSWGTEYLDIWIGTAPNDANSDLIQKRVVRYTNSAITADVPVAALFGLNFGNNVADVPTDLSKHINMFGGSYGFSITGNTLNVVSGGTTINYLQGGALVFDVTAAGISLYVGDINLNKDPVSPLQAATKQYVDAHAGGAPPDLSGYLPLTGGTVTGLTTFAPGGISLNNIGSQVWKCYVDANMANVETFSADDSFANVTANGIRTWRIGGDAFAMRLDVGGNLFVPGLLQVDGPIWSDYNLAPPIDLGHAMINALDVMISPLGHVAFNTYIPFNDIAHWKYLSDGYAGVIYSDINGALAFLVYPYAVAGSLQSTALIMTFDQLGNLIVPGSVNAKNSIVAQKPTGWAFVGSWDESSSNVGFYNVLNNLYIDNADGTGTPSNAPRAMFQSTGDLNLAGRIFLNGVHGNSDMWIGHNPTDGNRYHSWAANHFWLWIGANGQLLYYANGVNDYVMDNGAGSWNIYNNQGPMGGKGPYLDLSAREFKSDISDATEGLECILKLKPSKFNRITAPLNHPPALPLDMPMEIGFVAEDVLEVIPEAVIEIDLINDQGTGSRRTKALRASVIGAVSVKAIQEMHAMIVALTARVAELEQRHV